MKNSKLHLAPTPIHQLIRNTLLYKIMLTLQLPKTKSLVLNFYENVKKGETVFYFNIYFFSKPKRNIIRVDVDNWIKKVLSLKRKRKKKCKRDFTKKDGDFSFLKILLCSSARGFSLVVVVLLQRYSLKCTKWFCIIFSSKSQRL